MIKYIFFLLCILPTTAWAGETPTWYIGANLLSPGTLPRGLFSRTILPIFANMENGIAINGGIVLNAYHGIEVRTAFGASHANTFIPQLHIGYNRYFLDQRLFTGLYLRYFDNYNTLTNVHFFNLSPYLTVGTRWQVAGPVSMDARIGWDFASVSWSSLEHSQGVAGFILLPPTFALNLRVSFPSQTPRPH